MIKKQIVDYLMACGGKLNEGETWVSVGKKFGVTAKNKARAKKDKIYKNKAIGRTA